MEEIWKHRSQHDRSVIDGLKSDKSEYKETNRVVTFQGMVYVPKDRSLLKRIIYAHHDTLIAGHPGQHKTLELICRNYWWPTMRREINCYVLACLICQLTNPRHSALPTALVPQAIPNQPWEFVSVDIIRPLLTSAGFDTIMVCVYFLVEFRGGA